VGPRSLQSWAEMLLARCPNGPSSGRSSGRFHTAFPWARAPCSSRAPLVLRRKLPECACPSEASLLTSCNCSPYGASLLPSLQSRFQQVQAALHFPLTWDCTQLLPWPGLFPPSPSPEHLCFEGSTKGYLFPWQQVRVVAQRPLTSQVSES
jgi:hypothetical protein